MGVDGLIEGTHATGVVVPGVVSGMTYRAETIILATGGLYGGGITSDHHGQMAEVVFDLPLHVSGGLGDWFDPRFCRNECIRFTRRARAHQRVRPIDAAGRVVLENVRVAGRALAGASPLAEGSTEGVWLATPA